MDIYKKHKNIPAEFYVNTMCACVVFIWEHFTAAIDANNCSLSSISGSVIKTILRQRPIYFKFQNYQSNNAQSRILSLKLRAYIKNKNNSFSLINSNAAGP